jgi:hypothetical protein
LLQRHWQAICRRAALLLSIPSKHFEPSNQNSGTFSWLLDCRKLLLHP